MPLQRRHFLLATASLLATPALARAQGERVVNLFSSRHYDSDQAIYDGFARETGIRVRRIEANADQLLERLRAEAANSPADVMITVDAGRLARAQEMGLLQPARSDALNSRIPAGLRDPEGHWFGLSTRARVVMYDRTRGLPDGLARYEDLAKLEFRNAILVRSSGNGYNVAWAASMLRANGAAATEDWARGVVANMARPPQGGDRDQISAMIAGQGRLAISNTYYLGLMHLSQRAEDRAVAERVAVLFPNQGDRGTHANISGAGLLRNAPNREAGLRFLEYLTGPRAQEVFALGNMEYPAVADAPVHPFLASFGDFKREPVDGKMLADLAPEALRAMQRAGWR